jgi:hypothetical protein
MADGFFSSSWQILQPYGCAIFSSRQGRAPHKLRPRPIDPRVRARKSTRRCCLTRNHGVMADVELDSLYWVQPDAFTTQRPKLVAAARQRGDAAAAKRISAARKPTTAAWIVNRLVTPAQVCPTAPGRPNQGRCGRRPRHRLGSRFVPAKGSTDQAGEVRRLGTEPCGRAVAGGPAAATRGAPARPGKSRCG